MVIEEKGERSREECYIWLGIVDLVIYYVYLLYFGFIGFLLFDFC